MRYLEATYQCEECILRRLKKFSKKNTKHILYWYRLYVLSRNFPLNLASQICDMRSEPIYEAKLHQKVDVEDFQPANDHILMFLEKHRFYWSTWWSKCRCRWKNNSTSKLWWLVVL